MVGHGGMEGTLTTASLAQHDPSLRVRQEAVESLYYSGADQQAARILQAAPPELWQALASRTSMGEISKAEAAARMVSERRAAFERLAAPGNRLYFPSNGSVAGIDTEQEVFRALAALARARAPTRTRYIGFTGEPISTNSELKPPYSKVARFIDFIIRKALGLIRFLSPKGTSSAT